MVCTAHLVSGRCMNTFKEPEVTVADSDHLLVNWRKSFEGCDSGEVQNAKVQIGSEKIDVTFADKEAKIEANPCLTQPSIQVKLRLEFEEKLVWSHPVHYNKYNNNPKLEHLYSGLLQSQEDKQLVERLLKPKMNPQKARQ